MRLYKKIIRNLKKIFKSFRNFYKIFINLILFAVLIKPMFQINYLSGIFLIVTFLYVFLIRTDIIIRHSFYVIVLFIILLIRSLVLPILFKGLGDMKGDFLIEGVIFVLVWILIYLQTRKLQRH